MRAAVLALLLTCAGCTRIVEPDGLRRGDPGWEEHCVLYIAATDDEKGDARRALRTPEGRAATEVCAEIEVKRVNFGGSDR